MISLVCVGLFWGDLERITQMESIAQGLEKQETHSYLNMFTQDWDKRRNTIIYMHSALYIDAFPQSDTNLRLTVDITSKFYSRSAIWRAIY